MSPATMTRGGVAQINQRAIGSANPPNYLHWGSSSQAPVDTDTALVAPHTEARVAATSVTRVTGPVPNFTNDTIQWIGLIQANGAKVIREIGVFDGPGTGSPPANAAGESMWLRATFGDITMESALEGVNFTIQSQGRTS